MRPAINTIGLLRFPAILSEHSIEPLEFLSRLGINPNLFAQAGGWLPRDLCFNIAEQAAKAAGDLVFTAQVGASIPVAELGEYGKRILAAHTLGEALALAQNASLVQRGSLFRLEADRRKVVFHVRFLGDTKVDPQQFLLGTLAAARNIALLAGESDGVSVQLSVPKSAAYGRLEEFLGSRLEFGARDDAMIVDRELLSLPVRSRDMPKEPVPVVVARLITEMLPAGDASLRNVARRLGCSERTIERHMTEFGTTFGKLLDVTRRDEAIRLAQDTDLNFAQISQQVGYSDQANFNHAFHRWTGTTPTAMRYASVAA